MRAGGIAIEYDPLGLIAKYGDITFTTDPLGIGNVLSDSKGAEYIYGNGLEARIKNGKVSYYVTDVRGSVVAIVDDNGNITHKYQYDEYGKVVQKEEADYNPFQYVGKYGVMYLTDHQYYMRARHYDPTIGRFLSEDPIWSTNLYPYANNNPIMGIDPEGTFSEGFVEKALEYGVEHYDKVVNGTKYVTNNIQNLGYTSEAGKLALDAKLLSNPAWETGGNVVKNTAQNTVKSTASNAGFLSKVGDVLVATPISTMAGVYSGINEIEKGNTLQGSADIVEGVTADIAKYTAYYVSGGNSFVAGLADAGVHAAVYGVGWVSDKTGFSEVVNKGTANVIYYFKYKK